MSNATSLGSGWQPEPSIRGTTAILTSCVSTLIFSAWSAVHIGISWEGPGTEVVIKIFWLFVGLFAPELLFLRALNEFLAARYLLRRVKETYAEVSPEDLGVDGETVVRASSVRRLSSSSYAFLNQVHQPVQDEATESLVGQDIESQSIGVEQSEVHHVIE